MELLLAKFMKNFMTSLIIFYAKKLVYYFDTFYKDLFESSECIECNECNTIIRLAVLEKISTKDNCPRCGAKLEIERKEYIPNEEYNSRISQRYNSGTGSFSGKRRSYEEKRTER